MNRLQQLQASYNFYTRWQLALDTLEYKSTSLLNMPVREYIEQGFRQYIVP